jgi:hypothetical protein
MHLLALAMASPYLEVFKEYSPTIKPLAWFPSWPSGVESTEEFHLQPTESLKKEHCHGNYSQAEISE